MSQQTSTKTQVSFDCVIGNIDKRLSGPTVNLVEQVLEEAGLEGFWTLRDSRRIRKKGRSRFGVVRLESRGGTKSIRIWCKPRGNDTGFEYSLYPPNQVDIEMAFKVLQRVNPVTLCIPESRTLPGAVFNRIMDIPAVGQLQQVECVEIEEEEPAMEQKPETPPPKPIAAKPADPSPKVSLLALDPAMSMSDQEVADRALMAISFVAESGYARKSAASDSIVEHLGIREFAAAQEGDYKTVQGSMRALTMALWKKWRYIERVRCSNRRGKGFSESIRAYRITEKGEKRIEAIKDRFGEPAKALMNPLWRRSSVGAEDAGLATSSVASSVSPSAASSGIRVKGMSEFKKMASLHDEAERQITEIDAVIEATDSDIRLLRIELEGLESVEIERRKKIQELQEDLARVAVKKGELAESIRKKEQERSDWEAAKAPHEAERKRVESLMGFSEG